MSAPVNRKVSTAYLSNMYKSKPPPKEDIPEVGGGGSAGSHNYSVSRAWKGLFWR